MKKYPDNKSREVAERLLIKILGRRQLLNQALIDDLTSGQGLAVLEKRDRAFARLLLMTVLRRLGQIDDAINHCLDKPLNRAGKSALNILRLAAAQALFLRTPGHALANGAVRSLGSRRRHLKGLVNAVSRRLTRDAQEILITQDAARLNCPDWLWCAWSESYGLEATRKIVGSMLSEPELDLTFKKDAYKWAEALQGEVLANGSLRCKIRGPIEDLPGFREGEWWVQDVAAAMPVKLLGRVEGKKVLDLCAAPGGKTAQLAASGALVTAIDNAPKRLDLLRFNLKRLNLKAETIVADALSWRPDKLFDYVLLDAPCSATGTIRRHPDIWHLRKPEDVQDSAVLQGKLLHAASEMVAPGGTLLYVTCSLQPEEGEQQIGSFLDTGVPYVRRPIIPSDLFGMHDLINSFGDMRTLTQNMGGMDGFYACRLIRNS